MYGATPVGGALGFGAIYRVMADGQLEVLAHFTGASGSLPGSNAASGLTLAGDGNLYGVTVAGGAEGTGTVFKVVPGGPVTSLASFTGLIGSLPGFKPVGSLAVGADGNLYGTTREGGAAQAGSFFRVNIANGAVVHLASFTGGTGALQGFYPQSTLTLAGDGQLYGASDTSDGLGMIFRINTSGSVTRVAGFTGNTGAVPGYGRFTSERFTADGLGNLYGTSGQGGAGGFGTIFKIAPGGTVTHIASFTGTTGALPGAAPQLNDYPTLGRDGFIYGTTESGGTGNNGTIYRVSPGGVATNYALFTGSSGSLPGSHPRAPLTQAGDGNLYGTTRDGNVAGLVFRLVPGGAVTPIGSNVGPGGPLQGNPLETPLTLGINGDLYGIAQNIGGAGNGAMFRISPTTGVNHVTSFADANGSGSRATLTAASDGRLYGTARTGGNFGFGLVYRISTDVGRIEPVGNFTSASGALPGNQPFNRLVADNAGTLYGSTLTGGSNSRGTVFRVVPGSSPEYLAQFFTGTLHGVTPLGEMFRASDGFLYGPAEPDFANRGGIYRVSSAGQVTELSGTLTRAPQTALREGSDGRLYGITPDAGTGFGTVFAVNRATGAITTLGTFTGQTGALPGRVPRSRLAVGSDGNLYGSTTAGGVGDGGTIFKVTTSGIVTSVATFTGTAGVLPGGEPTAALVQAGDGNLYGVTRVGGAQNAGVIFRVLPGAVPRVETLAAFTGTAGALPGSAPLAELLSAPNGVLYGTTSLGGASSSGTLFRVEPAGEIRTVANFTGSAGALPGATPTTPLALAADGNLYGTTSASGSGGGGTLYRLVFGPGVTTQNATTVSFTQATLNASINPKGEATEAYFEYGTSTALGASTAPQVVGSGNVAIPFPQLRSGLTAGTTYYFRAAASNRNGLERGAILSFQTSPALAPTVQTTPATDIRANTAILHGSVNPNGAQTLVHFDYSTSATFASGVVSTPNTDVGSEGNVVPLAATVTGLLPGTLYYVRTVAQNAIGTRTANIANFTTNTPPSGGTFAFGPLPFRPGTQVTMQGISWNDPQQPLTYEFFFDGAPLGPRSAASSITFMATTVLGPHSIAMRVFDALGDFTESTATVIVNDPPTARDATLGAVSGASVSIPAAKLLAYTSDANDDAIEIIAVSSSSARGGPVALSNGIITYSPPPNYVGPDSFTYSFRDARGGTGTGTVNVNVTGTDGASLNLVSMTRTADGFEIIFAGIPGDTYLIQFTNSLAAPVTWQTLTPPGPISAGPNGLFQFEDKPNPISPQRFFRAAIPQ